jgi:(4S)-4-hydroxy-5-phosphonooxypentane-2,3-dione isomerase
MIEERARNTPGWAASNPEIRAKIERALHPNAVARGSEPLLGSSGTMENFALVVEFQVRPDCLDRFHEAIAVNARASIAEEPGCRQFDVLYNTEDKCRVVLYEIYDSEAAFAEHKAAQHTQTFLAAAKELVIKQSVQRLKRKLAPAKALR